MPHDAPPTEAGAVFEEHFDFVWRSVRRLGVSEAAVDDVVQDVFVVVHRRLGEFAQRSSMRTWLYGIVLRVVADHRRAARRRANVIDDRTIADTVLSADPDERLARREAARVLQQLLDGLDDDKRAVFVGVEIEGMTVPEVAEALGLNLNTAYARLRAARRLFEETVAAHERREAW